MDSGPFFSGEDDGRGRGSAKRARRGRGASARADHRQRGQRGYEIRNADPDISFPMLTLPSIPAMPAAQPDYADDEPPTTSGRRRAARDIPDRRGPTRIGYDDEWAGDGDGDDEWAGDGDETYDEYGRQEDYRDDQRYDDARYDTYRREETGPRRRERSAARPLSTIATLQDDEDEPMAMAMAPVSAPRLPARLPTDSVPELAAFRIPSARRRPHVNTRALVQRARSPWSVARLLFSLCAMSLAIWTALLGAGEPSQPLMAGFVPQAGAHDARSVAALVQPETQGMRPDLYDSNQQFNDWWDAACSAAVSSEVLTAWGVPNANIGKMIDVMQPDISLDGGLLSPHGFERGAEAFGYRADISWKLDYKQMLYLTNTLGLPVIVNVRISYGYYHFFSGGHFLVMTGGDSQGLSIVDSSEYYIKYLPIDTFNSMFTGMTTVIVPKDYIYTIPNI